MVFSKEGNMVFSKEGNMVFRGENIMFPPYSISSLEW